MTNSRLDSKFYMTHLFNGEFKRAVNPDTSILLEILPGTASPIKDQWIAASQIEVDNNGKPLHQNQNNTDKVLWLSDKKGLLKIHRKTSNTTRAVRVMPDYHDICFVPKEIPMRAFMTHGEKEWSEPILDFLKKNLGNGHLLVETWLKKRFKNTGPR